MFNLIARLRTRPAHERHRISFLAALVITLAVAVLWLVSLFFGGRLKGGESTPSGPAPGASLFLQIKQGIGSFADVIRD